jgi:hypothetical protein
MKTKNTNLFYLPLWILSAMLILAGCSKEGIKDFEYDTSETDQSNKTLKSAHFETKSSKADQNSILAQIRSATAKYHDIEVALADGYVFGSGCVSSPLGGMGYHVIRFDLVASMTIDPDQPQVLLYEPMKNGKMRLVGVEFLVNYHQWNETYDDPPMLGNQPFDAVPNAPAPPDGPGPTYQLHVWVWKNNPLGIYFPFNPNVSCDFATEE